MNTIELNVTGMTCKHCQAAVESALQNVAGVSSVVVDLSAGKAKLTTQDVPLELLIAAVAEEGYSASLA